MIGIFNFNNAYFHAIIATNSKVTKGDCMNILVMVKPDAIEKGWTLNIIDRFTDLGFKIEDVKRSEYTDDDLNVLYHHLTDKPFWPRIRNGMHGKEYVAVKLGKGSLNYSDQSAVSVIRHVVESIRETMIDQANVTESNRHENLVHGSSSVEDARKEVEHFFHN